LCADISVTPLSQLQFIDFYSYYKNTDFDSFRYKQVLPECTFFENPLEYYNNMYYNNAFYSEFKAAKLQIMNEYLLSGGYPDYFNKNDILSWQKNLIEDIIDRTLLRDLVGIYNIKSPDILRKLLYHVALTSGKAQSFAGIGKLLSVDTVTMISYLKILADNQLVVILENLSGGTGGVIRKNRRFYLRDCGLRNALLKNTELPSDNVSSLVENSCVIMGAEYASKNDVRFGFWRETKKESRLMFSYEKKLVPITVYSNDPSPHEIKALTAFLDDEKCRDAFYITKNEINSMGKIHFIPYWML
jgi:predicted AAA+ superfamily ATPase